MQICTYVYWSPATWLVYNTWNYNENEWLTTYNDSQYTSSLTIILGNEVGLVCKNDDEKFARLWFVFLQYMNPTSMGTGSSISVTTKLLRSVSVNLTRCANQVCQ